MLDKMYSLTFKLVFYFLYEIRKVLGDLENKYSGLIGEN
jgi:hypothetical protein